MSKLSHPSMGKVQSPQVNLPKPQTYVVADETQTNSIQDRLAQFEAPSQDTKTETGIEFKMPVKKSLPEVLEKLIFIGRISEEIPIAGSKFEITTLTNREHAQIIKVMYGFTDPADLFTIRILTLANALKKIDGVALDDLQVEGDFEDDFHKRLSIVDNLQLSIVEKLYSEYEKLLKVESDVGKDKEELKNS